MKKLPPLLFCLSLLVVNESFAEESGGRARLSNTGLPGGYSSDIVEYGGKVVLGTRELYSYDGNQEGRTELLADVRPTMGIGRYGETIGLDSNPSHLIVENGLLYFVATEELAGGGTARSRFIWDGSTLSGPVSLSLPPMSQPVKYQGDYYYFADFGSQGIELGRSSDFYENVTLLHETFAGDQEGESVIGNPVVSGDSLYWKSIDGRLHRFDGSSVTDILAPGELVPSAILWAHEGKLYFHATRSGVAGLYEDDGSNVRLVFSTNDEFLRYHGGGEADGYVSSHTGFGVNVSTYYRLSDGVASIVGTVESDYASYSKGWDSFTYEDKVVAYVKAAGQSAASWQEVTATGFVAYPDAANQGSLSGPWSAAFHPLVFEDKVFYIVYDPNGGGYGDGGTHISMMDVVCDGDISQDARIINFSSRAYIGSGDEVLIAGIVIDGPYIGTNRLQINARGQSLPASVDGRISDPRFRVFNSLGQEVAFSDNWGDEASASEVSSSLAGPPASASDASTIVNLSAGSWTVVVDGVNGATGVGIVELIDLSTNQYSNVANVSTRGHVGTGDNVLIGGVVVEGDHAESGQRILINGRGPSINSSVPNRIPDPVVSLHDQGGSVVDFSDDWVNDASASELNAAAADSFYGRARPASPYDAAVIRDIPAGGTTAILYDKGGSTGIGIIEFFAPFRYGGRDTR